MPDMSKERIIRKPELQRMVGLSDATIWRKEKNKEFPKRVQLGGNSVGWVESEIIEWINRKKNSR